MRAAVYSRYGPPEVVRIAEVETPVPKADEVLVRILAATVCAADWRLRRAEPFLVRTLNGLLRPKRFTVLGVEFAGTVAALGGGVSRFKVGDLVFGATGGRFGAHAEFVCLPESGALAIKPDNMAHEDAAAVLFGGGTALHFLRQADVRPGQKVLIYGASGSVGVFAVQLAKHLGAHVTAVCSAANLDLVRLLGADAAVDYTRTDFSSAGRIYDVVFDVVGKAGLGRSLRSLKRGGVYLQDADPMSWMLAAAWRLMTGAGKTVGGMSRARPEDVTFLKGLIEAGELRTVIDRRYPLAEIAEAHRLAESGRKKGHVLVLFEPSPA